MKKYLTAQDVFDLDRAYALLWDNCTPTRRSEDNHERTLSFEAVGFELEACHLGVSPTTERLALSHLWVVKQN